MDIERWNEIFGIYQDYGINHVRFHSWCPPEAAFRMADKLGMILQVEPPLWDGYGKVGSIPERAAYILEETGRIVDTYGNHPSFCLMSLGNELGDGKDPYLAYLIDSLKKKDPRHLYTSTTHPAGMERKDDYFNAAATENGSCRGTTPFTDYREALADLHRPLISHELGQPAMYPNYREIEKYTGHLKPEYLKVFRKSLEDHHMLDQSPDFYKTSGALLVEIYKENIEAQLRTPNVAGFQLLDIQDYPGHGLASIGILDAFLDSKGLITPAEFRRFCRETVPLIRMPGFVYTNDQTLIASVEVAHYGKSDLNNQQVNWKIQNSKGKTEFSGSFSQQDILTGTNTMLGEFKADLSHIRKADQLTIEISIPGTEIMNSWKCWVYPKAGDPEIPEDIYLTTDYNEKAREILMNGGKVLLIPEHETMDHVESARWEPVFWSYQLFKQPRVMGILCDPDHPALKEFPTDLHSDWQWKNLLDRSEALILDHTPPDFRPIIQFVPDFNSNHKLSALMEARVGKGALMVCNIDLLNNSKHPASVNQLLKSILNHMQSKQFMYAPPLDTDLVDELLKLTPKSANESEEPDASKAVVNIDAGALATIGQNEPWTGHNKLDQVTTLEEGFNYNIDGSIFKDHNQSIWVDKHLKINVSCPVDFHESFYVYMLDQNDEGRAAHIFFCGMDKGPLPRYDRKGVWLKYEVTPEMARGGQLVFDARTMAGPNVTVHRLLLLPE